MTKSSFRRLLPLGLLMATIGCSGGLNCGSGCADAYPYPQTSAAVPNGTAFVDDGVRMRLSQSALDFITENLRPILASQLGGEVNGQLRIPIPAGVIRDSTPTVEYGAAGVAPFERYPTTFIIDAEALGNNLTVEFVPDGGGSVRVRADDIPVGVDMRLFSDFGFGNAACHVTGSAAAYGGAPYITGLTLEAIISPSVGSGAACDEAGGQGECLKINVEVVDVNIGANGGLDGDDIDIFSPPMCNPTCFATTGGCNNYPGDGLGFCSEQCSDTNVFEAADAECTAVCGVSSVVLDFAVDFIGAITGLVQPLLDEALTFAIRNALEDVDGAPLSASGRLDVAGFAPGILPDSALDLGFAVQPTSSAFRVSTPANGTLGMDLVLKSGFEAAPSLDPADDTTVPHPCVRPIVGTDFAGIYGGGRSEFAVSDSLLTPLTGRSGGNDYDLGASLAKASLNQALFALYNSGTFCLEIGTEGVNALTGGGVQLAAGTLDLIAQGKVKQFAEPTAPAIVAINPSQPPVISYGAGTVDEGHIILNWPNVEVGFYILMYERFSRVFAVQADISMQVAVFNDPGTETLRIAVVDGPRVGNYRENYNELLPGVNFTEVMETLVGVAFDAALGDSLEFNYDVGNTLSDVLGIPVFIDFQGIETLPAGNPEVLNVYLSMDGAQQQPRTASTTRLQLARDAGVLRVAEAEDIGTMKPTIPTGMVRLQLTMDAPEEREYFARTDFGAWRGPLRSDGNDLVVKDAKLNLPGEHTVTVRSRFIDEPNSLEEGTAIKVMVDAEAPRVRLERHGDFLVAVGSDDATNVADLQYAFTFGDDDKAGEFAAADRVALADIDVSRVSVVAKDKAGNVSRPSSVDVKIERQRSIDERELNIGSLASGCAAVDADHASFVGLAALVLVLRRRRRSN